MVNYAVIKAMILEKGESVVNVHTEHKSKRKRRAGGVVDLLKEPERISVEYPFQETANACPFVGTSRLYIYSGVNLGVSALLQNSPLWEMI